MHQNSRLMFTRHAAPHFQAGATVLEIGPDGNPSTYRRLLGEREFDWRTADLADVLMPKDGDFRPLSGLTYVMSSEYEIPVADNTFDIVLAGQVIEHVRRIWVWLPELARVTRPGGKVVLISPISWPYHAAPYDCWRIYPDGMRALCDHAGLDVLLSEFESLERPPSRSTYHGVGSDIVAAIHPPSRVRHRIKALVGWPASVSLDLVTVAQVPR